MKIWMWGSLNKHGQIWTQKSMFIQHYMLFIWWHHYAIYLPLTPVGNYFALLGYLFLCCREFVCLLLSDQHLFKKPLSLYYSNSKLPATLCAVVLTLHHFSIGHNALWQLKFKKDHMYSNIIIKLLWCTQADHSSFAKAELAVHQDYLLAHLFLYNKEHKSCSINSCFLLDISLI